jgi:glucokinase
VAKKGKETYHLGIDLGGTKILAAVVDEDGNLLAEAKKATRAEAGPEVVIERIADVAQAAIAQSGVRPSTVAAAGIGAPGPVDVDKGIVYSPPNLAGWDEIPLGPQLAKVLEIPVFVDNDVNLGTLGEFVRGAGQGTRHMVAMFVGTGIGGGLIADGKLHRGFRGAAGEIGHMIIVPNGPLCGCGRRGCLEAVASRTAMEREIAVALAAGQPSALGELIASSKQQRLTSGVIAAALARQDPLMVKVMENAQFYLGVAVASIVNFFDPEAVVLGGGVVEALGESFVAPIGEMARPLFLQQKDADRVRIVPASLGDHAGVLGAAIMAASRAQAEL